MTFKIALVGGFGNFYLVKRQIADKFKLGNNDRRQENILLDRAGCERAISLGAALLAGGCHRYPEYGLLPPSGSGPTT